GVVGFVKVINPNGGVAARYFRRVPQLERFKNRVNDMTSHISERARTIVPPSTPFKRQILRRIVVVWDWSLPQIPIQRIGNWTCCCGSRSALRPNWSIGPAIRFCNITDHSCPYPFADLTDPIT